MAQTQPSKDSNNVHPVNELITSVNFKDHHLQTNKTPKQTLNENQSKYYYQKMKKSDPIQTYTIVLIEPSPIDMHKSKKKYVQSNNRTIHSNVLMAPLLSAILMSINCSSNMHNESQQFFIWISLSVM